MSEANLSEQVNALVTDCLAGKEDGALIVEAIVAKFGFDGEKIQERSGEIRALLDQMPDEFHRSGGGGWSFLNLCMAKNGQQWADEHRTMEGLVALSIAAGMGSFQLPRDIWESLPGGMPYIVFDTARDQPPT